MMNTAFYIKQLYLIGYCILLLSVSITGQEQYKAELNYISPVPGSKYIMPGNNIALRHGDPFSESGIKNDLIRVKSSKGDEYQGRIILSDDKRTVIFLPDSPYQLGDEVTVTLREGLKTQSGLSVLPLTFNFFVTDSIIPVTKSFVDDVIMETAVPMMKPKNKMVKASLPEKDNNLPEGYAPNEVWINNNPPDGYYFYAPFDDWNWYPGTESFLTITDRHGTPVYYRKLENEGFDLKVQPGGYLSFYSYHPFWKHQVMDSSYRIIGTYQMGNGYTYTDFHDFVLTEDGHAFVMTFDPQLVDMSQIVPGGNPEAIVSGFVMQEQDASGNVIFQWRSWDHFEITETGPEVDLTAEMVDPVHGNTIEVESDTSFLISSRNMHEITKIHRNTGDIIWRLGGAMNQFELVGDTIWFNRQHDSRRIANGHVTAYDNGTKRPDPKFSSAVEYAINPEDSTATLVNRYRQNPDYLGIVMGNSYWTPENTIVVGWGSCVPGITEFDNEGNILFELFFEAKSYRAFRFPWKTNYFLTGKDSVSFSAETAGEMMVDSIQVINPGQDTIAITSYYTMTDNYGILDTLPVFILPDDSVFLQITFIGDTVGLYRDILTLNSDINSDTLVQRIAQQVDLHAEVINGQHFPENSALNISIYPNPAGNYLIINNMEKENELSVKLYNSIGQRISSYDLDAGTNTLGVADLDSGFYMISIESSEGIRNTFKIVKQ